MIAPTHTVPDHPSENGERIDHERRVTCGRDRSGSRLERPWNNCYAQSLIAGRIDSKDMRLWAGRR